MKKIGFDIHGVIDFSPKFFSRLSRSLVEDGNEVHIITGASRTKEVVAKLSELGIEYTHFFSIVDWCVEMGIDVGDPLNPVVENFLWDSRKAMYCRDNNIDIHFDDTPRYSVPFEIITTRFVLYEHSTDDMDVRVLQTVASIPKDCENYPCNKQCPQYILYKDSVRKSVMHVLCSGGEYPYHIDRPDLADDITERIFDNLV